MIFLKAGSSIVPHQAASIPLPAWSKEVHHEVELAVQLRATANSEKLVPSKAAVSLDLTARDIQSKLKLVQWPWTLAKSFKGSTPLGPSFDLEGIDLQALTLKLQVNGKTRQLGSTADMISKVEEIISYVQSRFPVVEGDWLLTGTPNGVSRLQDGDEVLAQVINNSDGRVLSEGKWRATRA